MKVATYSQVVRVSTAIGEINTEWLPVCAALPGCVTADPALDW
jgi:hypothetical protein